MHSTGLTIVWFLVIIALIPLSLWMLKRSGLVNGVAAGMPSHVKPVSQFNLGPGQRLVTVEVGAGEDRKWLVLGVTAQTITTLHTMNPQADLPTVASHPVASFASILRRSTSSNQGQ